VMQEKKLWETPIPSTSFEGDSILCGQVLRFQFYRGAMFVRGGIRFKHVLATRTRAERCCTPEHIKAYDSLIELENSTWLQELSRDTDPQWRQHWEMHHFMIYLDSAGSFEIVAQSWESVQEETGPWP
jgi:hypothetical protein